ncbi:MAG: hypothetical protein AB7G24_00805 [Novosphingobium sp.]
MRKIILNTARVDNSGQRRAAGEAVNVGEGPDQITTERAQAMISSGQAALPEKAG